MIPEKKRAWKSEHERMKRNVRSSIRIIPVSQVFVHHPEAPAARADMDPAPPSGCLT
jgi:hypothetical protein